MSRNWIIILAVVLAVLVIIQFFQPKKNTAKENLKSDIVYHMTIPANVKKKIVNACYDCHSNTTHYPFYSRVAPVSWLMANHISRGKSKLNFTLWADYAKKDQVKLLDEICEVLTEKEMPIRGYVFMHRKARFNEREIADVCAWAEQAAEEALAE